MGREPDILEGDVLEVEYATADGSYATSRPDRARPPRRLQHYFPTEEWRCNGVCHIVTSAGNAVGPAPVCGSSGCPRHPCGGPFKSISLSFAEHPAPIGR